MIKSLVFVATNGVPVLVLATGTLRIDRKAVEAAFGYRRRLAPPARRRRRPATRLAQSVPLCVSKAGTLRVFMDNGRARSRRVANLCGRGCEEGHFCACGRDPSCGDQCDCGWVCCARANRPAGCSAAAPPPLTIAKGDRRGIAAAWRPSLFHHHTSLRRAPWRWW